MTDKPRIGIFPDLSRRDYDQLPLPHWSTLKLLAKSPAHYRYALLNEDEDTDDRRLGRAVHIATYEPDLFGSRCVTWDGGSRRGKEWDAFRKANAGREILTEAQAEFCRTIQTAVRADATAAKYLSGGQREVSVLWQHAIPEMVGVPGALLDLKCRIDFVTPTALVDLKTCVDASPAGFGKTVWNFRYDAQCAFYQDAFFAVTGRRLPYVLVAVEKKPPHMVGVYRVNELILDAGREHYRNLLELYAWCRRDNRWPGYGGPDGGELEIEMPRWSTSFAAEDEDLSGMGLEISEGA